MNRQALMPGLETTYSLTVKPERLPLLRRRQAHEGSDRNQLLFSGLEPVSILWEMGVRENRRFVRVSLRDLNALMERLDLPEMPVHLGYAAWQEDVTATRCLGALRSSLRYSGAPAWCSEMFAEDIFGQPWVGYEIIRQDDPTQPYGFRNEEELSFYIPGPRDLTAPDEDGCTYCLIYRANNSTLPKLDYHVNGERTVIAVAHKDIAALLRSPDAVGAPKLSEVSEGVALYTAESIHETRDVLHALSLSGAPTMPNVVCTLNGNHTYYRNRGGRINHGKAG